MKKHLILFVSMLIAMMSFGQTQQGYVRTLGRPEKKGEALSEVTVRVKGEHNHAISNTSGKFELVLTNLKNGDAYSLQQVKKNGYELNETDMIGRQLAFSDKVPLTIVMVSSEQLQADKQRIENNAYETAEKNYKAKYSLLEKQLSDNEITAEQYREEIQDLQDKFEKYQSLIDGLAEHYAHTDYDVLDEKDREINICIENGDLERADSLIRTLFDPIGVLERNMKALAKLDMQIGQANDIIAQANEDMAAVLKQQEKDGEYLYQLYTIALARYDQEKASQYIETRALLDTTNASWQFDAALYFSQQNEFEKAEKFYLVALDIYNTSLGQSGPQSIEIDKVYLLNNLALLYLRMQRSSICEPLFKEAHNICEHIDSMAIPHYALTHAKLITISNLCNYYLITNQYTEAGNWIFNGINIYNDFKSTEDSLYITSFQFNVPFYQLLFNAIQLLDSGHVLSTASNLLIKNINLSDFMEFIKEAKDHLDEVPESYGAELCRAFLSISRLYADPKYQSEREEMLKLALDIGRHLAKNNPQAFEPNLIDCINGLADFYSQTNRIKESEVLFKESLEITRRLAKDNPEAYKSTLSRTLNAIGAFYLSAYRFPESEQMLRESLEIEKELTKTNPNINTISYAETLNDLALTLLYEQQYAESESLYKESIGIYRQIVNDRADSLVIATNLAGTLYNLANLYRSTNRVQESIQTYEEAIDITKQIVKTSTFSEENGSLLIKSLCELSGQEFLAQNFNGARSTLDEALEISERLSTSHSESYEPLLALVLNNYANYNRDSGNYLDGQKQYQRALEIYRNLAERYHAVYLPQLVSCLIDYSILNYDNQQYNECEPLLEEALSICRQNYKKDDLSDYTIMMAQSLLYLGYVKLNLQEHQQAITITEESYEISSLHKNEDNNFLDVYISSTLLLSELYGNINKPRKAYQLLIEIEPLLNSLNTESPELWQERYIMLAGSLSYFAIFVNEFQLAEQFAIKALTIDPSQQWIFSNLAAAQLFQGKYAEAEEIYRNLKNELKDSFLQDFNEFEAAGVIPKERKADVERIRKMLNE